LSKPLLCAVWHNRDRNHPTQSSPPQQRCHSHPTRPNARSCTAEKDHHNHTTRPVHSTPTGLAWNQSTGSARLLKPQSRPRPPDWPGTSSPRRVLACGRINGAGQALYHAYSVLLPVRHAQRLVIRCARPFVYICFIVLSQRHIPARLSRSQSCWFPWSTRSSSSPSSPSGTWSYSPPSFWRAVRRRLPKRRNATRRRPARPPAGLFLHSLLVAWQPKPHLALRSPGRALPNMANQPSTPPNSTTPAPIHRLACPPCDPCASLPPNRASRGTEEPQTRPRPPQLGWS